MSAVRISPDLEKKLDVLAQSTHRSRSYYVNKALESFLEDREDYMLAASRLKNLKAGKSRTYTLEEVAQELNLPLP